MQTIWYPAQQRGKKDIGWLKSNFHFSFSDYYNPVVSAFGTLLAFNDDFLEQGKGFGIHPHQNMEIISILLEGKMNHKDSMGYSTHIEAGGVQIMSAGQGLFHEEYNIGAGEANFLQIWIQPKLQNVNPRYQQRAFPRENRKNRLTTVVSSEEGLAHCWINQNAYIALGFYEQAQALTYHLKQPNKCVFLFCVAGKIQIAGHTLLSRDALGIWDTTQLDFEVAPHTEFVLIETVINQK
ncbi:MAG TPA: pirin family protein [Microscillaceae bacterium]|nr:pirin family protein [Microscillaceae bacterium]